MQNFIIKALCLKIIILGSSITLAGCYILIREIGRSLPDDLCFKPVSDPPSWHCRLFRLYPCLAQACPTFCK